MLRFDFSNSGIDIDTLSDNFHLVNEAHNKLMDLISEEENKEINNYVGWVKHPTNYDKDEFDRILSASKKIRGNSDVLVVIGIGGSYLGSKAIIEALGTNKTEIMFLGNSLSTYDLNMTMKYLKNKDFSINVISKSGTTLEPAIAFRILKDFLIEKYGEEEAISRIYITTDKEKGALKEFANKYEKETFIVPDNIGGRYSVFSAVGLLPIAVAGLDIKMLLEGAKSAQDEFKDSNLSNNSYLYALIRYLMYTDNEKDIEILVSYEPRMRYFIEWYKQLFAESEGKDGKAIFPTSAIFTTDLHSIGQLIQDGERNIFETVLDFDVNENDKIFVKEDDKNLDGLNYLSEKSIDYINKKAMEGTIKAHIDGNCPNILLNLAEINEKTLGYLMYFFMKACAISALLIDVNPFDQPGVEDYKKNMFKLLGK